MARSRGSRKKQRSAARRRSGTRSPRRYRSASDGIKGSASRWKVAKDFVSKFTTELNVVKHAFSDDQYFEKNKDAVMLDAYVLLKSNFASKYKIRSEAFLNTRFEYLFVDRVGVTQMDCRHRITLKGLDAIEVLILLFRIAICKPELQMDSHWETHPTVYRWCTVVSKMHKDGLNIPDIVTSAFGLWATEGGGKTAQKTIQNLSENIEAMLFGSGVIGGIVATGALVSGAWIPAAIGAAVFGGTAFLNALQKNGFDDLIRKHSYLFTEPNFYYLIRELTDLHVFEDNNLFIKYKQRMLHSV